MLVFFCATAEPGKKESCWLPQLLLPAREEGKNSLRSLRKKRKKRDLYQGTREREEGRNLHFPPVSQKGTRKRRKRLLSLSLSFWPFVVFLCCKNRISFGHSSGENMARFFSLSLPFWRKYHHPGIWASIYFFPGIRSSLPFFLPSFLSSHFRLFSPPGARLIFSSSFCVCSNFSSSSSLFLPLLPVTAPSSCSLVDLRTNLRRGPPHHSAKKELKRASEPSSGIRFLSSLFLLPSSHTTG